jgi:hypothetical protein
METGPKPDALIRRNRRWDPGSARVGGRFHTTWGRCAALEWRRRRATLHRERRGAPFNGERRRKAFHRDGVRQSAQRLAEQRPRQRVFGRFTVCLFFIFQPFLGRLWRERLRRDEQRLQLSQLQQSRRVQPERGF